MAAISPQINQGKKNREDFISWVASLIPQGQLPTPLGMQVTEPGTWQGAGRGLLDMLVPQPEDTMMGLAFNPTNFQNVIKSIAGPDIGKQFDPVHRFKQYITEPIVGPVARPRMACPIAANKNRFFVNSEKLKKVETHAHDWLERCVGHEIGHSWLRNQDSEILKNLTLPLEEKFGRAQIVRSGQGWNPVDYGPNPVLQEIVNKIHGPNKEYVDLVTKYYMRQYDDYNIPYEELLADIIGNQAKTKPSEAFREFPIDWTMIERLFK